MKNKIVIFGVAVLLVFAVMAIQSRKVTASPHFATPSFAAALMLAPQQSAGTSYSAFNASFAMPAFTSVVGAGTVQYTAGSIYAGGVRQAIVASTTGLGTLGASSTCTSPTYATCTFIYWTSGTSLSVTNTLATAIGNGNVLVGYVTTDGSSNILTQVPATLQISPTSLVANTCGTTTTCGKTAAGFPIITVAGTGVATTTGAATITALPFTDTTYTCMGYPTAISGTTIAGVVISNNVSATSVTFKVSGNTGTDVTIGYRCFGY